MLFFDNIATRARGCAGSHYPFLTRKERDNETGLDYFLARYYLATQGRFTSPDEFSGGPAEIFNFTSDASQNPTFYADLTNPQSLNKYQYTYNNPLGMTDDNGHCPVCISETHRNVNEGVIKEIANIGLGMNNLMADFKIGNAKHVQLFEPSNKTQEAAMNVTGDVLFFAGLLTGKAQVGGVAIAESETTAVVAAETGNAERTASSMTGTMERTAATAPYARPSGATTPAQRASVQGRPCSVCGESAPKMYAGHKEALAKEYYRTGTINRTRMRNTDAVRPECPTCSNREGAQMKQYSITMRNQIPK